MKSLIPFSVAAVALLLGVAVIASDRTERIEPGDKVVPLQSLRWLSGDPIPLPSPRPVPPGQSRAALPPAPGEHLLLLLWESWAGGSAEAFDLADRMQRRYPGLKTIAVSRETAATVRKFLDERSTPPPFPVALDLGDRMFRAYLGNDIMVPRFLVIGPDKNLLWSGDPLDLPETLDALFRGKYDPALAKALVPLFQRLRMGLQTGNTAAVLRTAEDMLERDRRCGAAVRAGLFVYESRNQPREALRFVTRLLDRDPGWFRLYMLKLELELRSGSDAAALDRTLAAAFKRFPHDPDALNAMTWFALDRIPFRLRSPARLLELGAASLRALPSGADPALRASCCEAYARIMLLTGRPEEASAWQAKALAALPEKSDARTAALAAAGIYAGIDRLRRQPLPPTSPLPAGK